MSAETGSPAMVLAQRENAATPPLVPSPAPVPIAVQEERWAAVLPLPCTLTIMLPIPRFSIRDLLALAETELVQTAWKSGEDVPVDVGGVRIGWAEFEVVERRLAVRVTRMS